MTIKPIEAIFAVEFEPYCQGLAVEYPERYVLVKTGSHFGINPKTKRIVAPDYETQTQKALKNIKEVLNAVGGCLEDIVLAHVWVKDMSTKNGKKVERAYLASFKGIKNKVNPAYIGVQALLYPDALVQIEAEALVPWHRFKMLGKAKRRRP